MARIENRTEIHRKFAEQIQAIKSIARENQRVADVLERGVENIPTHVITLATDLIRFLLDDCPLRDALRQAQGERQRQRRARIPRSC
jgi:hypothetical protein